MKKEFKLTEEQRGFAADNHEVLMKFLDDKKLPFDTLADACKNHVKALFLTGDTANKICECVKAHGVDVPTFMIDDFDDTVKSAYQFADKGDTVLLSPACASFDKFKNFEVRGDHFIEVVKGL